jgi:NADPH:quinone reductase-like Zn-dependent oxidoreductase
MKKVVVHSPGGYEVLRIEEHPDLQPRPNQVVVETKAIGINYADCCVRWGVYESAKQYVGWPITPGFEFSGHVKSVGREVTRWRKGDPVFGVSRFDAYASQVAVNENAIFAMPMTFNLEQAAGFPAVHLTAFHAIHQLARIRKGGRVLVHSAAGGVGTALLQLAKLEGFESFAVVGSGHKVDTAREFGATHVIDKSKVDLWRELDRLSPQGFDAIFDANGGDSLRRSYERVAPVGKLFAYGAHTLLPKQGGRVDWVKAGLGYLRTPKFAPMDLISRNRAVIGFNLSFLFERADLFAEGMETMLKWIDEGKIAPPKTTPFDFHDVAKAHAAIESGQTTGKLVLTL